MFQLYYTRVNYDYPKVRFFLYFHTFQSDTNIQCLNVYFGIHQI